MATALAALTVRVGQIRLAGVSQYMLGVGYVIGYALAGLLPLLVGPHRWRSTARGLVGARVCGRARRAGRAAPAGGLCRLFASADADFERFLADLLDLDLRTTLVRLSLLLLYAWLLGGLLREMLLGPDRPREWTQPPSRLGIGAIELTVVLGLIDVLFCDLCRVPAAVPVRRPVAGRRARLLGLRASRLFRARLGGWSEPAAAVVVALVHPQGAHVAERMSRGLAMVVVGLLFLVMASAMQRMLLYVVGNGLTELRVQALALMAWLAVVLVWFAVTVLRGQRRRFAFGALMLALSPLAA